MSTIRIDEEFSSGMYFLTLTVLHWYYLFDRWNRFDILLDSLKHCQKHKELKVYAWVFMINHIHLIAASEDMIGFTRDFKKFTSKELQKNIVATEPSILKIFEEKGEYHFWQPKNMPKVIETEEYFLQKKNYIEQNPVKKLYVRNPEHWIYSSANPESLLQLDNPNDWFNLQN